MQQGGVLPSPRFAYQLAYDPQHDTYYMFGGKSQADSNKVHQSTMRLDDLWTMKVRIEIILWRVQVLIVGDFRSIGVTETTSSSTANSLSENRGECVSPPLPQ